MYILVCVTRHMISLLYTSLYHRDILSSSVKTASEMTYTVSGGALNSTQSNSYGVTITGRIAGSINRHR